MGMPEDEAEIDRLPLDLLSYILSFLTSFRCLGRASLVCRKWRKGVDRSYARNERLSFTGWSKNDDSTARLVGLAYNLKDLDISRSCWGCQITDDGLYKISFAKCVSNLTSISLWGMTGITDKGVIVLDYLKHETVDSASVKTEDGYQLKKAERSSSRCCSNSEDWEEFPKKRKIKSEKCIGTEDVLDGRTNDHLPSIHISETSKPQSAGDKPESSSWMEKKQPDSFFPGFGRSCQAC